MKQLYRRHKGRQCARWLTAALMLAALPTTAGADVITVQRSYDTSTVEVENVTADDGNIYSKIKWGDLYGAGKPGAPDLPVEYVRILVPVYTNNFTVRVTRDGNDIYIPIEGRIYPVQQPRTTNATGPADFQAPDGEAYAAEANMIRAEVVGDGFVDGCNHIVTVAVYPFNYNDDTMELTADTGLTLELGYDQCDVSEMTSTPIFPPHRSKYAEIESMVVNPESEVIAESPEINPDAAEYYYIIAPRDLAPACEDLAVWKRQKGYKVVIKEVEEIFETPKYTVDETTEIKDEAASLREYLKDEFAAHGAFFCLLVGDYRTSMPIRKATCQCMSGDISNRKPDVQKSTDPNAGYYVPTDSYFGDLTYKYKLTKEKDEIIYSFPHTVFGSFSPSIFVGRLLCDKEEGIRNYTKKLILYESNPGYGDNEYLDNYFTFIEDDKTGENRHLVDEVYHYSIFKGMKRLELRNTPYYTIEGDHALEQINKSGLSSWVGHGTPYSVECHYDSIIDRKTYISSLDKYGRSDIGWRYEDAPNNGLDNLTNYNKPGVGYSVSCTVTPFDSYTTDVGKIFNGPNIGEVFTTYGNYGGVAFCGNTRIGYSYIGELLEKEWLKAADNYQNIGYMETISKFRINNGWSDNRTHVKCAHNLIGDPELTVWRGKPKKAAAVNIRTYESVLEIIGGSSIKGSEIRIYNGKEISYKNRSSEQNHFFSTDGASVISAWKYDYLPTVRFFGSNTIMQNDRRTFIVRDAYFSDSQSKFIIGNNASLKIWAIDSLIGQKGFEIHNGGRVNLKCEHGASLEGTKIKDGGKVCIEAEELTLGEGFEVELGGEFEFNAVK